MPLPKRAVAPVHVARAVLPAHLPVPSELEAVTNGTLANTVRQLSSLSRHAEDLFGELAREAGGLAGRAQLLQARLDRLSTKVQNLDANVEDVTIQDIQMRKAFKSSTQFDQQIFSRATMPTAMLETYASCERPPPLDKLNPYRDDGRDGLKFYTDPGYFFELWRQEMLQDTERIQHDRGKKVRPRGGGSGADAARRKQRVRAPPCTRDKQRELALTRGEHLMPQPPPTHYPDPPPSYETLQQHYNHSPGVMMLDTRDGVAARPNSIELSHQYQPHQPHQHQLHQAHQSHPHQPTPTNHNSHGEELMYGTGPLSSESLYSGGGGTPRRGRPSAPPPAPPGPSTPSRRSASAREALPPPPPPPASPPAMAPSPPAASPPAEGPPPPPPPPPPPEGALTPPPPPPLANGDIRSPVLKQPLKAAPPPPAPLPDPRDDLLKAIRDGIKLRKVEKTNSTRGNESGSVGSAALHDVASILARRVAVEFSESDSGSDSEADSDGWAEPPPA